MKNTSGSPKSIITAAIFISTFFVAGCANATTGKAALIAQQSPPNAVFIDTLDFSAVNFWLIGVSGSSALMPAFLDKEKYYHNIQITAEALIGIDLNGAAKSFISAAGIEDGDDPNVGGAFFQAWVDGRKAAESPIMHRGDKPFMFSVDLSGAKRLELVVNRGANSIGGYRSIWGGPLLLLGSAAKGKPTIAGKASDEKTPSIDHPAPAAPAIHGPRVVGASPGKPFLFMIPATGQKPLEFSATKLPAGLALDRESGIISGAIKTEGEYVAKVMVNGPEGATERELKIVGRKNAIALTPPMGWNSWYGWGLKVDDAKVREAAYAMVQSGLSAHGYQYILIDDGWAGVRDADGKMIPEKEKFPDMKALADYVHSKGLKIGIYSSPGPQTCGGREGSYKHEAQDAATYAEWGFDYLKYDWCSYLAIAIDRSAPEFKKPYIVMGKFIRETSRDFVYSLCQYGMDRVWEWGGEVGGNMWLTTGDIGDVWGVISLHGFNAGNYYASAKPGNWNDPDMLMFGNLGGAWGQQAKSSRLGKNEQITQMTIWCMLAAPLIYGGIMSDMDPFTVDLLTNDEVLAIDLDPLGAAGRPVKQAGMVEVWSRPLWDGSIAVALFNREAESRAISIDWKDLGISGPRFVRDLWEWKDLGAFDASFSADVPAHGSVLLKVALSE